MKKRIDELLQELDGGRKLTRYRTQISTRDWVSWIVFGSDILNLQ
jgi:hypothetical protein